MRLKIKLKFTSNRKISTNYYYPLSASIYKLLQYSSPAFSSFLHEKGYIHNNKPFKLFTFSLGFPRYSISENMILVESNHVYLYISSPLEEDIVKNLLIGSMISQKVEVVADNIISNFDIEQVELVPAPKFNNPTKFLMNSPMVLSKQIQKENKLVEYYYRYNDDIEELNKVLNTNLIRKYELTSRHDYAGEGVILSWDYNYINRQKRKNRQIQKRVLIYKDYKNPISLIGIKTPFTLEGDTELMKVGYECGFGKNNAMGMGMVEVVK